jgi:5-methyltetrahydrofolate--homocysteine methyltransferase
VVTVGKCATERFDELQKAANYTEAYFSHGLAVQTAEAAADYLHAHICRELGMAENQGKRYSWGYPPSPTWTITPRSSNFCPPKKNWA